MTTGTGNNKRNTFIVLILFLALYVGPLGIRPFFIPDEARYAEIPREMIANRDWIVPHLNGLRYFEKPPMGYWIESASFLLFGETTFAARLPSALAAGLTALILFFLVHHFFPGKSPPVFSSFIFLTCAEVGIVGTINILDGILTFFLTGTMATFFLALEFQQSSWREHTYLIISGLFCGLAFLTKGFLAVAIPVFILVPYLLWEHRSRDLLRMAVIPLTAAGLTILPWSLLIQVKEPDFWRYFFWVEHIQRFTGGNEAQHKETFWFFALAAPGVFLPWSFLTPAAFSGIKKGLSKMTSSQKHLIGYAVFWFLMPFLFFSASNGKLLTYILPCFPPFAILASAGLATNLKDEGKLFKGGVIAALLTLCLFLVGIAWIKLIGPSNLFPFKTPRKGLTAGIALAVGIPLLICALRTRTKPIRLICFGIAPLFLLFSINFIIPDRILEKRAPGNFLRRHIREVTPETILVSERTPVQMVCWIFKRSDVYLLNTGGELRYGLSYKDASHRLINFREFADLVRRYPGRVVLIAWMDHFKAWKDYLPKPTRIAESGKNGFVFVNY
jgi:4-amino-4-deoxy-L-arabinose transferase